MILAGFGKRKDGKFYKKTGSSSMRRSGSTQSSGTKLKHKQKKSHHVPYLEIENFEYSNPNFATGFIVIDGINWNVVANVFPVRDKREIELIDYGWKKAMKVVKRNPEKYGLTKEQGKNLSFITEKQKLKAVSPVYNSIIDKMMDIEFNFETGSDGMAISPTIHNLKFIDDQLATGYIESKGHKIKVTLTAPEGDND